MFAIKSKYETEMRECPTHGLTEFSARKPEGKGGFYCKRCNVERAQEFQKRKHAEILETSTMLIERACPTHGLTTYKLYAGTYKCKLCVTGASADRAREVKQMAVDSLGGKCMICGYDKHIGALDFHHIDPTEKESKTGGIAGVPIKRLEEELKKCILVCANCHREVHGGLHPEHIIPV